MAAPTFETPAHVVIAHGGNSSTTEAFDAVANDVLVGGNIQEDEQGSGFTFSGGSLTWTDRQLVDVSNYCQVQGDTAVVDSNKNMTVAASRSGPSREIALVVARFSGSDGVGASAKTNVASGAPSLDITTTQDNSAIVVFVGDWSATDGSSRTWRTVNGITPTAANSLELYYVLDGSAMTVYVAYYPDAGTAGTKTVGLSAPTGQKYSIVAVEIKGVAAGTVNGSANLTGTGTASVAAVIVGDVSLAGAGSLSAAGVIPASANLVGNGSLSATGVIQGAASLTGAGSLTASAEVIGTINGAASLAGAGALAAAAAVTDHGTATLTGAGTVTAAGAAVIPGAANLTGAGGLTATPTNAAAAALTGAGSLSASGQVFGVINGSAILTGAGTIAASAVIAANAALTGVSSLTATGRIAGSAALIGAGSLSVFYQLNGSAVLAGTGILAASGGEIPLIVPGSSTPGIGTVPTATAGTARVPTAVGG